MVVFAGDLSPTGSAAATLARHPDPWGGLRAAFGADALWVANLEAAVGLPTGCTRTDGLCRILEPEALERIQSGPFHILSQANNHSSDLGRHEPSRLPRSRFPHTGDSAELTDSAGQSWIIVPLDLTSAGRQEVDRTLRAVSRARAHTPRVVAFLHSSLELDPRPDSTQLDAIFALHTHGAVLVVGAGAHVVQTSRCGPTTAAYPGLGNLWMDQTPTETQLGWALGCTSTDDSLTCLPQPMRHNIHAPPHPDGPTQEACIVRLAATDRRWLQHPRAESFVQVLPLPAAGPDAWVALWSQHSRFDDTTELRPYVFELTERRDGPPRIRDLWRGTALSAPIALMANGPREALCVLHRTDSVFEADADTGARRWQAWRWTGFGFEPEDATQCPLQMGG